MNAKLRSTIHYVAEPDTALEQPASFTFDREKLNRERGNPAGKQRQLDADRIAERVKPS